MSVGLFALSSNANAAFEASAEIDSAGLVSIVWQTRGGYGYQVQQSSDLITWQDIGYAYGTGNEVSFPVTQVTLNSGSGGQNPPPSNPPTYFNGHFALRTFAGMGQTLVSWTQPGQQGLSQALITADFTGVTQNPISSLPLFLGTFEDAANNEAYRLSFSLISGTYHASYAVYTVASLNTDEQERLAWFTDRLAEVEQAMLDAVANGQLSNGEPSNGVGSSIGESYRVVEFYQDSDGDGILDHHEFEVTGSDPWLLDSDHDGYSDLDELTANSDPNDASSTPGNGGSGVELPLDGDIDQDGVLNGIDADPLDRHVDWERQGFPRFAVLPVPGSGLMTLAAVNNHGRVIMNGTMEVGGLERGYYWEAAESAPIALPLSQLEITADLLSHLDENLEPVTAPVVFKLSSAKALDISDEGVIVGEGYFEQQGTGGGSSTGSSGASTALTVAVRWLNVNSTPELVHPGLVDIGDWGDLLLNSSATHVNEEGTIMGTAEYAVAKENPAEGEIPFEGGERPCLWQHFSIGGEGLELYPAEEPPPSPLPVISGIRRTATEFFGSYETAAYWNEWTDIPSDTFPPAGSAIIAAALMPNARSAIAGDRRLLPRSYEGAWVPALRTFTSGFALGGDGTVWISPPSGIYSMWQPLAQKPLSELIGLPNLQTTSISDVTDRNVAIGYSNGGSVILLPVVPLSGNAEVQTDQLTVAGFDGGGLIDTDFAGNHTYNFTGDPDRFRIAMYGLPPTVMAKINLLSENVQGLGDYDESSTVISLNYDAQAAAHRSEPLILVSDTNDDTQIKDAAGAADNSPDDPSHLIALGGSLVVDQLQLNGDPQLQFPVQTKYEVPELASVTVKLYPVMIGGLPSILNATIEEHVKKAMERYVQAGLKINYSIEDPVTVPATVMVDNVAVPIDLEDGLDFPQTPVGARPPLTAEEEAFFTHAASPSTDDVEVFYINQFSGPMSSLQGYSYSGNDPGFNPQMGENTIILRRNLSSAYVLAHELGHLLTGEGAHHSDRENLMYQVGSNPQTLQHIKRLSKEQITWF